MTETTKDKPVEPKVTLEDRIGKLKDEIKEKKFLLQKAVTDKSKEELRIKIKGFKYKLAQMKNKQNLIKNKPKRHVPKTQEDKPTGTYFMDLWGRNRKPRPGFVTNEELKKQGRL